jgi:hypothetical protein
MTPLRVAACKQYDVGLHTSVWGAHDDGEKEPSSGPQ